MYRLKCLTSFLWMQVPTFYSTSCWKDCPSSIKLSWHPCQLFDQIFWLSFLGPLFYFIGPCLSLCQFHSVLIYSFMKILSCFSFESWLDAGHFPFCSSSLSPHPNHCSFQAFTLRTAIQHSWSLRARYQATFCPALPDACLSFQAQIIYPSVIVLYLAIKDFYVI